MLVNLQVRDFAIVDRIDVDFAPGMTALTGETGAGKSILVDALGLVLGERGNAQLVRDGAKRAEFSAEFDVAAMPAVRDWLSEHSLDDDEHCLLRRVINADGRSRAFINGNAVPVQQLKTIGEYLVDIHGQHFHQSLGKRRVQLDLLDYYGDLLPLRAEVAAAFEQWRTLGDELERLIDADENGASRLELLQFQLDELRALGVGATEIAELGEERQRLQNSGKLADGVAQALSVLFDNEDANANDLVADAHRAIEALVEYDANLGESAELISSAAIQITEAADLLRRYGENLDMDPARRDAIEERLDAIKSVARKHRVDAAAMPVLVEKLESELDEFANLSARTRQLEQQQSKAREAYRKLANKLTKGRVKAAAELGSKVTGAMHGLGMPGGKFAIALESADVDAARASGLDSAEFEISANAGQSLMPLSKVASGGELSRMSLSIQVIASDGSAIPTMVFDEVDSGVGGGVAEMVGRRLADLGASRQVLCVTHLPQVASLATQQYRIAKVSDGKATRTSVQVLSEQERVTEIARMLGGVKITRKTLEHAAEMLANAPEKRA